MSDRKVIDNLMFTLTRLNLSNKSFQYLLKEYFIKEINSASTYHKYNGSVFDTMMGSILNEEK